MAFVTESGMTGDHRSNEVAYLSGPAGTRGRMHVGYQLTPWDEYGIHETDFPGPAPDVLTGDKCGATERGGSRWGKCSTWIGICDRKIRATFKACKAATYAAVNASVKNPGESGDLGPCEFEYAYQDAMALISQAIGSYSYTFGEDFNPDPGGNIFNRLSASYVPRSASDIFGGGPSRSVPTQYFDNYGPEYGGPGPYEVASMDAEGKYLLSKSNIQRLGNSEFCRHRLPTSWSAPESAAAFCPEGAKYTPITLDWSTQLGANVGELMPIPCDIAGQKVLPLEFYELRLNEYRERLIEARERWIASHGIGDPAAACVAVVEEMGDLGMGLPGVFADDPGAGVPDTVAAWEGKAETEGPDLKMPLLLGGAAILAIMFLGKKG